MGAGKSQARILTDALKVFFWDAFKVAVRNPLQAWSFFRTVRWQTKAYRVRSKWKERGVHVPAIVIFSITNRCNLECEGCYALAFQDYHEELELSDDKLRSIVAEAAELGISFFVLAGGEPFLRPEILNVIADYPEIIFLIFTNGLLIDDEMTARLQKHKNAVPLVSLEGDSEDTDRRRGEGTYGRLKKIMAEMKSKKIFFGTSLTLTRPTYATITEDRFIGDLVDAGCKFFLFIEYTPVTEDTRDWALTGEQWAGTRDLMTSYRSKFPALFIAVPWDEDDVGGCLAAGRGFVHVNANGDLEPCPFAPFSDASLRDMSLKEALQSELLIKLRERPELLRETGGGCGLWKNREQVKAILQEINAIKDGKGAEAEALALSPEENRS